MGYTVHPHVQYFNSKPLHSGRIGKNILNVERFPTGPNSTAMTLRPEQKGQPLRLIQAACFCLRKALVPATQ